MDQTRRLRKKDKTHHEIMHSAKALFEEDGISNVTIDRIAEGADVSRSTFFSHFTSVDDLLNQIADEEINDIITAANESGTGDISSTFSLLTADTCKYPYLMSELLLRNILSSESGSIGKVFGLIRREIKESGYEKLLSEFSDKDISAFILGSYFGLVFQKIANNEDFENPDEINNKIQHFINYLKDQEEKS